MRLGAAKKKSPSTSYEENAPRHQDWRTRAKCTPLCKSIRCILKRNELDDSIFLSAAQFSAFDRSLNFTSIRQKFPRQSETVSNGTEKSRGSDLQEKFDIGVGEKKNVFVCHSRFTRTCTESSENVLRGNVSASIGS